MSYSMPYYTYSQGYSFAPDSVHSSFVPQLHNNFSQFHPLTSPNTYYPSPAPTPALSENTHYTMDYPDSPNSTYSGRSSSDESLYAPHPSEIASNLLLSSTPMQASGYSSASQQPLRNSAIRPAETHTIHRNPTYTDEIVWESMHRLTDLEKRSLFNLPVGTERPNFRCTLPGCVQPWLFQKSQIKEHLSVQHKYNLRKPWACTCGSQFGRQVEADRHLEDQKPCSACGLPGRKLKGYAGGQVCHRCQRKNSPKEPGMSHSQ